MKQSIIIKYFCDKVKKKSAEELFSLLNKSKTQQQIYINVNDNLSNMINTNKLNNENFLFPENKFLKHIKDNKEVYSSENNFDSNNIEKWKKVTNQAMLPWYFKTFSFFLLIYLFIWLNYPYYYTSIINNKNKLI